MTLNEALDMGWPFRRRTQVVWFVADNGLIYECRPHRNQRSLRGCEWELAKAFTVADYMAADWEVLIWNSGFGRCDGVYSSKEAIGAAEAIK